MHLKENKGSKYKKVVPRGGAKGSEATRGTEGTAGVQVERQYCLVIAYKRGASSLCSERSERFNDSPALNPENQYYNSVTIFLWYNIQNSYSYGAYNDR